MYYGSRILRCLFTITLVACHAGSMFARQDTVQSAIREIEGTGGSMMFFDQNAPGIKKEMAVKRELFSYLRLSPVLIRMLSYDPALLGHTEYINSHNPGLAAFLKSNPQIVRDPEFYLFAVPMGQTMGGTGPFIARRDASSDFRQMDRGTDQVLLFFIFMIILGAIVWLLHMFFQNRRWSRALKVQTELHTKLLDKFGGGQELLAYLDTGAGRRILEAASLQPVAGPSPRAGLLSPISRILAPLQFGVVLAIAGAGMLIVKSYFKNSGTLLFSGTMALALGVGLILAAALSWLLARRLGLLNGIENKCASEPPR